MKNTLSVGLLSPGWPLEKFPNGIVTYVKNIVQGFDEIGINSTIVTHKNYDTSVDRLVDLSKYKIERNIGRRFIDPLLFRMKIEYAEGLKLTNRNSDFSRLISVSTATLSQSLNLIEVEESFGVASSLIKQLNIPIITRLHGPWFIHGPIMKQTNEPGFASRVRSEGRAIVASHGVTSPSLDVLNQVEEFYKIRLPNASVIPNPTPIVSEDFRWKYDEKKAPTILFVGRFDLHKGGDIALQAFFQVAQAHKDVELIFVGPDRGILDNGRLYFFEEYVNLKIKDAGIRRRIHFRGQCGSAVIADLRRSSHITLFTSRYDNFPLTLLEALSTGSPTIATAVGGVKEIVINNFNGILVDPNSIDDIANNTLDLLNSREAMERLSKNAISDSFKRFSPKIVAQQTADYYRKVI